MSEIGSIVIPEFSFGWDLGPPDDLSTECGLRVTSPRIVDPSTGTRWHLVLYPNGLNQNFVGYVSLFLVLDSPESVKAKVSFFCFELKNF